FLVTIIIYYELSIIITNLRQVFSSPCFLTHFIIISCCYLSIHYKGSILKPLELFITFSAVTLPTQSVPSKILFLFLFQLYSSAPFKKPKAINHTAFADIK